MKSCLVVDDSKVVRLVAAQILKELGFSITEAEDGKKALELSQKAMPDVVLLDWNMPVMNGIDYLKALRALPNGSKPIVVLCTVENDVNRIQQALTAGANEYIMKPFDRSIIQSKFELVGLI